MSLNNSDPLSALLAEHQESTVLDEHFKSISTNNQSQSNRIQPDDAKSDDDNAPIRLQYRHPSFTSLHGELITKAGKNVNELPELKEEADNPIIVFDNQDDSEVDAFSLSYRHPSQSTFDHDKPPSENNFNPGEEETVNEFEDDGEEDCPEVQIVKELNQKFKDQWKQIGYVPTKDYVKLARIASQSQYDSNHLLETINNQQTPKIFEDIIEEEPETEKTEQKPPIQTTNNQLSITPKHRRCGSNGMQLGEASTSLVRMSQALMITPTSSSTTKNANQTIPEETYSQKEDNFEEDEEEEFIENEEIDQYDNDESINEDRSELFGRLGYIVKEPKTSNVYKALLHNSSEGIPITDQSNVRHLLKAISEQCINNLWIEETGYVNNLVNSFDQADSPKKTPKRQANDHDPIQNLKERMKKAQQKYSNLIESETIKKNIQLKQLFEEYQNEAVLLDEKYQSEAMYHKYNQPSQQLIDMREKVKSLLRHNQIEQAKKEHLAVAKQEAKEVKENSRELRERYFQADRDLKETYAAKQEILLRAFNASIIQLEKKKERSRAKYEKLINLTKREQIQLQTSGLAHNKNASNMDTLPIKMPKPLNRNRDERILKAMADQIREGKDVSSIDIDALFRKSSKSKK